MVRATALLLAIYLYRSYSQAVDPLDVMTAGGIVKPNKNRGMVMLEPTNPQAIIMNKSTYALDRMNNMING